MLNYLKLIPYVIIAALAVAMFYYRGATIDARAELDKANANLSTAAALNAEKSAAIATLTTNLARRDAIQLDVTKRLDELTKAQQDTASALNDLALNDPAVKSVTSIALPDNLKRLLNGK